MQYRIHLDEDRATPEVARLISPSWDVGTTELWTPTVEDGEESTVTHPRPRSFSGAVYVEKVSENEEVTLRTEDHLLIYQTHASASLLVSRFPAMLPSLDMESPDVEVWVTKLPQSKEFPNRDGFLSAVKHRYRLDDAGVSLRHVYSHVTEWKQSWSGDPAGFPAPPPPNPQGQVDVLSGLKGRRFAWVFAEDPTPCPGGSPAAWESCRVIWQFNVEGETPPRLGASYGPYGVGTVGWDALLAHLAKIAMKRPLIVARAAVAYVKVAPGDGAALVRYDGSPV